jgi:hypothetical protein
MIVPHSDFKNKHLVKSTYLGRYLAVFVLYRINLNRYTI